MVDTANNGVIVCEPMSTIPTSPSKSSKLSFSSTSRPSTPISTYTFPRPLSPSKSDALKANPHPYPIRTTSTAVLSRSNSTARTVTTAHPHQYQYQYYVPQSPGRESPSEGKDAQRGGGRQGRHKYSKSLVDPSAVPSPSSTTTLYSHKNRSMSSLSSSESGSPTKSEEEEEEENDEEGGDLATGNNKKKRGRRRGGKVRGIVASFEGRGGPDDYSVKYQRERTESDASSVSSASSFGSFTDVKADDGGESNKLGSELMGNADAKGCSNSTPKRNNPGTREEPTMEELLASTANDVDPTREEGTVYDETVKLHSADVAYSTVTASSIRYSLPIPTLKNVHPTKSNSTDADDELSVEELLALVSNSETSTGASAWERDGVGCCTVKRVGDVGRREEKEVDQDSAEEMSTSHPSPPDEGIVVRQVSPTSPITATTTTVGERELGLEQEMSETREMVRALSARVASVEAKIGEMEIVAGELEVRGRQLLVDDDRDNDDDDDDDRKPQQGQSLPGRVVSTLYRTVFGGVGVGLLRMILPRASPKNRSREPSQTRAVLPIWYKKSWACYLLFLGLGACAFVLREVVRRGMMLRGRRT